MLFIIFVHKFKKQSQTEVTILLV